MKKYTYFLFSILFLTSCEDVIDLDLPEGETLLVVDGSITDQEGFKEVRLSTTAPYFEQGLTPPVSDALVVITDDLGNSITLLESIQFPGTYITSSIGVAGRTYTLSIQTPDGKSYISTPETLVPVFPIDSIYFYEDDINEDEYFVEFNSFDPPGLGNHYRWKHYINDEYQAAPIEIQIANDDFVDGNPVIGIQVHFDPLEEGDDFRVEQLTISKGAYEFLFELQQQTAFVGSLFDTPPAPIQGNITNVNDPEERVLGYFSASAISEASITVDP